MAAQKGKEILIKRYNGTTYDTVGGLRSKSFTLNKETVDITDSDSSSQWRELLAGAGVKSLSVSGSGVFKDSTAEGLVRSDFFADTLSTYQLVVPGLGTFSGTFDIPSIEYSGEYNAEAQFSLTLESAGAITFA